MKRILFFIISIVLFGSLFGCATYSKPRTNSYSLIKQTNINNVEYNKDGNIIIKRDPGFIGSAIEANFYINGDLKFNLLPGEFYQFSLPANKYIFTITSAKALNLGTEFKRSLRIEINNIEEKRIIRVFPMPTQGMIIEEIYEGAK